MTEKNWDMYQYILESKPAVRNIVEHQDEIFKEALDYCADGTIEQIYVVGSGTSYHGALACKKLLEDVLKVKVFASYPMQFKDNELILNPHTLVIGISQAGRSSSTIAALDKARKLGLKTIVVTGEAGKPVSDHADVTILLAIGMEYAGPKTKGYIGTMATIMLLGMKLAVRLGRISEEEKTRLTEQMVKTCDNIPEIADQASQWYLRNKEDLLPCRRMILVGYESCISAMMEGTLKILEAVRYSVVGYEQEEFMHGVYHSIHEDTTMVYLACPGQYLERCLRMRDYFARERHNPNYVITSDASQAEDPHNFVYPFVNDPYFATMEYIVPLQVLARKLSLDLGKDCNVASDPDFHKKMGSYTY